MYFVFTGQYTAQALNKIMEDPAADRHDATQKLVEAAGGKLISMYNTRAEGPGVLAIFDVPDPSAAAAICGVVVASGSLQHVKQTCLLTQEEVADVRQKATKLRDSYESPGDNFS